MLDFKIKDLRRLIQPREQQIQDLTDQSAELARALEDHHRLVGKVSDQIAQLKLEQQNLKRKLAKQKNTTLSEQQSLNQLSHDVAQIIEEHGKCTYV